MYKHVQSIQRMINSYTYIYVDARDMSRKMEANVVFPFLWCATDMQLIVKLEVPLISVLKLILLLRYTCSKPLLESTKRTLDVMILHSLIRFWQSVHWAQDQFFLCLITYVIAVILTTWTSAFSPPVDLKSVRYPSGTADNGSIRNQCQPDQFAIWVRKFRCNRLP